MAALAIEIPFAPDSNIFSACEMELIELFPMMKILVFYSVKL